MSNNKAKQIIFALGVSLLFGWQIQFNFVDQTFERLHRLIKPSSKSATSPDGSIDLISHEPAGRCTFHIKQRWKALRLPVAQFLWMW